jgi:hypothetical protein
MPDLSVGRELLDVPFPDMVAKLALGIAEGQRVLDKNSIRTAEHLGREEIGVIPSLTQTIDREGRVSYSRQDPVQLSLLQIGLNPAFYQFSESTIEVTMDIKTTTSTDTTVTAGVEARVGFAVWSASARLDVSHNRKFGREVHGTSRLATKLTPVPPPPRIFPEITVVDNRPPPNPLLTPPQPPPTG